MVGMSFRVRDINVLSMERSEKLVIEYLLVI